MRKTILPALFSALCLLSLSACGRPLEKSYDISQGLARMNSLSVSENSSARASTFASGLAVPGTTDFNAEGITAPACLLTEAAGKEGKPPEALAYKNPYAKTYPASITKIMSALVCLEKVGDLEQEFTVSANSIIREAGSSTAFLQEGETLRIEDLLYGMLLPSGNDASIAVAEASCGSVESFVEEMNRTALRIGCTGSYFVNPHGLPDDAHYTSPYDIYLILSEAMKHEEFRKIVSVSSYSVHYKDRNGAAKTQIWKGSNQYMTGERELPAGLRILGGKTGTTKKAGYCLAVTAEKQGSGEEYFAVTMKTSSKDELYSNMSGLLSRIR